MFTRDGNAQEIVVYTATIEVTKGFQISGRCFLPGDMVALPVDRAALLVSTGYAKLPREATVIKMR